MSQRACCPTQFGIGNINSLFRLVEVVRVIVGNKLQLTEYMEEVQISVPDEGCELWGGSLDCRGSQVLAEQKIYGVQVKLTPGSRVTHLGTAAFTYL